MRFPKNKKKQDLQGTTTCTEHSLLYKVVFLSAYISGIFLVSCNIAYAGDLFTNADKLLNDIYLKFVGMSTAAAGVGVGTGVFMKKLSLGKQDRIELGNKVVKDSIIGWGTLNAIGIILNFISNYTK
jgi:hypothetical protein